MPRGARDAREKSGISLDGAFCAARTYLKGTMTVDAIHMMLADPCLRMTTMRMLKTMLNAKYKL